MLKVSLSLSLSILPHLRGAVGARLAINASMLQSLLRDDVALIVQNMATMVTGLVVAFMENSLLALILLVFSSIVAAQSFLHTKSVKKFTTNAKVSKVIFTAE